jgi:radical SAM/SPASM domain protein of ACGX system
MKAIAMGKGRRKGALQGRLFILQWHVTARCNEECQHCYAKSSADLSPQLEQELSVGKDLRVLSSFDRLLKGNGLLGRINITGGDPLLKDGVIEIIKAARSRNIKVGILGNPGLLDIDKALELKDAGVFRYQLSIDGLRDTHDRLRGRPGHFDDTLEALKVLKEAGLPSVVMFTVSKENYKELPAVARLVAEHDVKVFDFARLVPQGRGKALGTLTPTEFREVLVKMHDTYRDLEIEGFKTYFGRKEALWTLLYSEMGLFEPPRWDGLVHSGCSAGSKVLTVLADGTVYPCRRLPVPVGKVPEEELADILFKAQAHADLRDVSKFSKCRNCQLLPYCRGCPAVAFGTTGDPFAPDPQCWKDEMNIKPPTVKRFTIKDHAFWARTALGSKPCAQCDGACGGCAHVCAACSEVCASCSSEDG